MYETCKAEDWLNYELAFIGSEDPVIDQQSLIAFYAAIGMSNDEIDYHYA